MAGINTDVQTVTLAEFLAIQEKVILDLNIGEQPSGRKRSFGNATSIQSEKRRVKEPTYAHDGSPPSIPHGEFEFESVNSVDKPPKRNWAFCLLQAPQNRRRLKIDQDDTARSLQYKNFCALHPQLKPPLKADVCKEEESVKNYTSMVETVENFLNTTASSSKWAVVIFNGHGSAKGMLFEEGNPGPLDDFLEKVQQLLIDCRSPEGWPLRLEVIFAQCFGHKFTGLNSGDVTVFSFTNDNCPRTKSHVKFDPLIPTDVVDSTHDALESAAKALDNKKQD